MIPDRDPVHPPGCREFADPRKQAVFERLLAILGLTTGNVTGHDHEGMSLPYPYDRGRFLQKPRRARSSTKRVKKPSESKSSSG